MGHSAKSTTQARGFYAMLGLTPGEYDVTARQIGMAPQKIHVRVLIGEVYPLDLKLAASAIQVEAVTVVAASGVETRTSESRNQRHPAASRAFAALRSELFGFGPARARNQHPERRTQRH